MGRSRFIVLALALFVLSGCGWTQYGGNAGRTGYAPLETGLTTANAGQAVVKWWTSTQAGEPVIGNGFLYGSDGQKIHGWPNADCPAPSQPCPHTWTADAGADLMLDPSLSEQTVLAAARTGTRWNLVAFDGTGNDHCTLATPRTCSPMWSADIGAVAATGPGAATVVDDRVFITATGASTLAPILVFDAAGTVRCTGAPRTCTPLFQLRPSSPATGMLAVADGRAFVPTATGIDVFDAAGLTGCTSETCLPIAKLTLANPGSPSAAGGSLFTFSGATLYAFDATLKRNCTASATSVCTPIWRAALFSAPREQPVIAAGRVYLATNIGNNAAANTVEVFDAAGTQKCNPTTHVCSRLWRVVPPPGFLLGTTIAASANLLIMASSDAPGAGVNVASRLSYYDLKGVANCSGSPLSCSPVANSDLGSVAVALLSGRIAVANGIVAVSRTNTSTTVVGLP